MGVVINSGSRTVRKYLSFVVVSALVFSACSPGMFSGKPNDSVAGIQSYRRINTSCSQLNLSSSQLDTPTFRKLVDCFNSEGGLDSVAKLVHDLPEAELSPVVQALNRYLLSQPKMLFQIESSLNALKARGDLDSFFGQSLTIFKHPQFVQELIGFLADAGSKESLQLLAHLAPELNAEQVATGIDAGLSITGAQAFQSFQLHLRGASPSGRDLLGLSQDIQAFYQSRGAGNMDLTRDLLKASVDGRLFQLWDDVIGTGSEKIAENVALQSTVMEALFGDNAALGHDIASLFHYLNGPLDCLSDSKEIPNANMNVFREISLLPTSEVANYIRRTNFLTILAVKPFCNFPPELSQYYGSMIALAETSAIEPAATLLKSLYQNGLAEPVVGFIADTGKDNTQGIQILLPVLSELTERGAWPDILLNLSLLRPEDRKSFTALVSYWLSPSADLAGRSPYDLTTFAMKDVSAQRIYHLLQGVGEIIASDEKVIEPLLQSLRSGYYANGFHPFVEMGSSFLSDAASHQELFASLAKISQHDSFPNALTLLATMSKDGRLRDVVESSLTLFHKFSLQGASQVVAASEPVFTARRAHNLSGADLKLAPFTRGLFPADDPCSRLSIAKRFEDEIPDYFGCADQKGGYDSLSQAFAVLNNEHAEDGRKYLNIPMDLINQWDMKTDQARELINVVLRSGHDGSLDRLTGLFPLVITQKVGGAGPALRPLIDVIKPVMEKARESLHRVLDFVAEMMVRPDLPAVLDYAEKLSQAKPEPSSARVLPAFDLKEIMHSVHVKECVKDSESQMKRTLELVDDYQNAISAWELVDGHPRRSWKIDEIHAEVAPIFKKLGDPAQSSSEKPLLNAAFNVVQYFSLKPGDKKVTQKSHYAPEELGRWFNDRAKDYRVISYLYPGETKPRAKLVTSLDRLEEVLVGADFKFALPDNFALKFLQMVGESWGDEDRSVWPAEIQNRFPYPKAPPTLRKTYEKIAKTLRTYEDLLGLPKLHECEDIGLQKDDKDPTTVWRMPNFIIPNWVKANLFNLHEVLSVLEENLPDSGTSQAGGLKLLRDLFWELHSSSPLVGLSPNAGWENNLSLVARVGRLGIPRQLSRQLQEFVSQDDLHALDVFSEAFVATVNVPELKPVLGRLFGQTDQKLLWKVIDQVLALFDGDPADGARLKQEIFYFIVNSGQMEIIDPVLKAVQPVLDSDLDFFTDNADLIHDYLKSKDGAYLMRSLYEDPELERKEVLGQFLRDLLSKPGIATDAMKIVMSVDTQPEAKKAIDTYRARMDEVEASAPYQRLEIGALGKDMFHFFTREPRLDTRQQSDAQMQTADTVRRFFAARIHSPSLASGQSLKPGELEEFLDLAARKPDEFYQILSGITDLTQSPSFTDFVKLAERSLPPPR